MPGGAEKLGLIYFPTNWGAQVPSESSKSQGSLCMLD